MDRKRKKHHKLFKTNCLKKCQYCLDYQVMANVATRKIKPSVAWDDKGTCPTADGRDAQSSDNQTNRLLDLQRNELGTESVETDSGLTEESPGSGSGSIIPRSDAEAMSVVQCHARRC